MSNKNCFLAVRIDAPTLLALERVGRSLEENPSTLLNMPEDVGFDFMEPEQLHMTFLFFGECLRNLEASQLRTAYAQICEKVSDALSEADTLTAPLEFIGFELFPPQKRNLVVARFKTTDALLRLRDAMFASLRTQGISMPASFFTLIEGEGAWSPHVTLGRIRASKAQIGSASCNTTGLSTLAPSKPLQPHGLTLLGERPPRAYCDWDDPLMFGYFDDSDEFQQEETLEQEHAENYDAVEGSASGFAAFEEARLHLLSWLRSELVSCLDASDAEALHAGVEAVVLGIDPAQIAEADAEDAIENVTAILSGEGDRLESISKTFQQCFNEEVLAMKRDIDTEKE